MIALGLTVLLASASQEWRTVSIEEVLHQHPRGVALKKKLAAELSTEQRRVDSLRRELFRSRQKAGAEKKAQALALEVKGIEDRLAKKQNKALKPLVDKLSRQALKARRKGRKILFVRNYGVYGLPESCDFTEQLIKTPKKLSRLASRQECLVKKSYRIQLGTIAAELPDAQRIQAALDKARQRGQSELARITEEVEALEVKGASKALDEARAALDARYVELESALLSYRKRLEEQLYVRIEDTLLRLAKENSRVVFVDTEEESKLWPCEVNSWVANYLQTMQKKISLAEFCKEET